MGKKNTQDRFADREAQNYENPIASREFILELLQERARPITERQLSQELNLSSAEQKEALRRRLKAMVRDGQLLLNRRGAYGIAEKMELIKGRVIGHKDGFGFLIPDDGSEDLFLSARQMRSVFPEDEVLARISGIDHKGRKEGTIVDVLQRHTHELVGRFFKESGIAFLKPSNQRITQDIAIDLEKSEKAESGQMVVVTLLEQPTLRSRAIGKVVTILGDHMAPGMEIDVAIRNHELPHEWPKPVLKEADKISLVVNDRLLANRLDLRECAFVTIDGEDAKDFDDAVYCEKRKNGWILYVAIADVSHYVLPHSALDKEALNRGNSVYFPGCVIPMLPEILSNELCSLKPKVDRLSIICEMHINTAGKITRYQFHEGVIRSKARLTYTEVYEMMQQGQSTAHADIFPHLEELFILYPILHKARKKRGAIDFDLPEPRIIFGVGRKIEQIVSSPRNDAHRLIEECMLCANICAAKFLTKQNLSGLFRIHEGPAEQKLKDLHKFLAELGLKLPGSVTPTPKDYAALLSRVVEREDAHLIQTVLLRSLSQAIYSPDNKGHFGLAYETYTHFTSPIRRYPDLIVHRLIRDHLRGVKLPEEMTAYLTKMGDHCSMTERRADEATREVVDWLKCEYMMEKVGEEFKGVITGVTHFGLFIELSDVFVEGLVHISMLRNDYYHFDPIKHSLLGERTGKRYRLGDVQHIKVVRVDLDQREIDLMLVDDVVNEKRPKKESKKKNKHNKRKK